MDGGSGVVNGGELWFGVVNESEWSEWWFWGGKHTHAHGSHGFLEENAEFPSFTTIHHTKPPFATIHHNSTPKTAIHHHSPTKTATHHHSPLFAA
jgi:hypothetical protein